MAETVDIETLLDARPEPARSALRRLHHLILETATATPGVGKIEQGVRWGQPSYLTPTGSTIRIDALKGARSRYALYVHCQTDLLASFRDIYGDALTYQGKRALVFDAAEPIDEEVVARCIALALTYRSRKRARVEANARA